MGNRFIEALHRRCKYLLNAPPTEPSEVACVVQGEIARVADDRIAINAATKDSEALAGASWHLVLPGYEFSGGSLRAKNARASIDSTGNAANATSRLEEQPSTGGSPLLTSPSGSAKERSAAVPAVRRPLVSLAVGLTAGCLVALLVLQLRHSDLEREMVRVSSLAASTQPPCSPAMVETPCGVAALVGVVPLPPVTVPDPTPTFANSTPLEDGAVGELVPVANVAMANLASAAAPTSWRPTKSKRRSRTNAKASSNAHSSVHSNVAARIEMEASQVRVSGRAVAAVITLKRMGSKHGCIRVRWKTLPGTATPSKDYEGMSRTVQFADGQMQRTIFVPIHQPSSGAEPRTFSVVLERAPRGSPLGSVTSTTVTILGDG